MDAPNCCRGSRRPLLMAVLLRQPQPRLASQDTLLLGSCPLAGVNCSNCGGLRIWVYISNEEVVQVVLAFYTVTPGGGGGSGLFGNSSGKLVVKVLLLTVR